MNFASLATTIAFDSQRCDAVRRQRHQSPTFHQHGKTIKLPDPLFAEINGYAHHVSATPVTVIRQAWNEFRRHHPHEAAIPPLRNSNPEDLLAMVQALRGSIALPPDVDGRTIGMIDQRRSATVDA